MSGRMSAPEPRPLQGLERYLLKRINVNPAVLAACASWGIMEHHPPPLYARVLGPVEGEHRHGPAVFHVLSEAGYRADAGEEEGTVNRRRDSADQDLAPSCLIQVQ